MEAVRSERPAGRQLSFLDGSSSGDGGAAGSCGDDGCGAGDGGGVTILRTNVTVFLLNPLTVERILLIGSRGYLAGCFRPIMTVSTHIVA